MELKFENIEVADNNILEMNFSSNYDSLVIDVENGFLISDGKWLGKTKIMINNWENLILENYISESQETEKIDWKEEFYELEMIQEIIVEKDLLSLSGFAKKRKGWLTYRFENCEYSIIAEI